MWNCNILAYSIDYIYFGLLYISIKFKACPCILRPPFQPEKYGLKLKVVLKWRDIYIETIRIVSLIAGLKIERIIKWRGLKSQGLLYHIYACTEMTPVRNFRIKPVALLVLLGPLEG